MAGDGEEVRNKQVLARDYIHGNPNETDMYFSTSSISLKVPEGSKEVLVKNLYLSCDQPNFTPTVRMKRDSRSHRSAREDARR